MFYYFLLFSCIKYFNKKSQSYIYLFIYFGLNMIVFNTVQVISRWVVLWGRGNQYIQLVKVLYCKLLTIGKPLPTFPHKVRGLNYLRGGRQLCYQCATEAPYIIFVHIIILYIFVYMIYILVFGYINFVCVVHEEFLLYYHSSEYHMDFYETNTTRSSIKYLSKDV